MATVTSPASPTQAVTTNQVNWVLKDPLDPTLNTVLFVESAEFVKPEQQGRFAPLGRTREVVIRGDLLGERIQIEVLTLTGPEFARLEALRGKQRTLLLQSDDGQAWYVSWEATRQWKYATRATRRVRRLPVEFVEVDEP